MQPGCCARRPPGRTMRSCASDCRSPTSPGRTPRRPSGRPSAGSPATRRRPAFEPVGDGPLLPDRVIGPPEHDMLEGYTALAFAAGRHRADQLGTLVTGVTYRHPGLLAKTVTSLDVLSGGRAWLGIGAAWNEEEHRGLGVPFPLDAGALRAARGDAADLPADVGRRREPVRRASTTSSSGRSTRRRPAAPHPPILIGGGGEKKTLRLVAQYADACNLFDTGLGPEGIPRKLDILREHCEDVGRDYAEIDKTVLARVALRTATGPAARRAGAVCHGRPDGRAVRAAVGSRDRHGHPGVGRQHRRRHLRARRRGGPAGRAAERP